MAPAAAPPEPGLVQWLGSVAAAVLVNWLCLQLTATSFILLNALGACSDSALGACVTLTSLAPALLAAFALSATFLALRVVGLLRTWRRWGVSFALLGFVAAALWQGVGRQAWRRRRGSWASQRASSPCFNLGFRTC